jgi:hypothetical protein
MSFREKSAWVMVAALLIAGANYLLVTGQQSLALGHIAPPLMSLVIVYVVVLVIIAVFGATIIALLSPKEAEAGADERDRLIAMRAGSVFGQVLAVGVVGLLGAYLFGPHYGDPINGDALFQGLVIALMIAQITEYIVQIWLYRRGV